MILKNKENFQSSINKREYFLNLIPITDEDFNLGNDYWLNYWKNNNSDSIIPGWVEELKEMAPRDPYQGLWIRKDLGPDNLDWMGAGIYNLAQSNSTLCVPENYIVLTRKEAYKAAILVREQFPGALEVVIRGLKTSKDLEIWLYHYQTGYISLDDWNNVDPTCILNAIQKRSVEFNIESKKNGFEVEYNILGWVQKPILDRKANTVCWALKMQGTDPFTSAVVIKLGRRGFVRFEYISHKASVEGELDFLINAHSFDEGFRYEDYILGDQIANYGIATLITEKILAK